MNGVFFVELGWMQHDRGCLVSVVGKETRPRLLDLCCGAGGAGAGYDAAGWDVVGVDIADQPSYPFEFYKADAVEILKLGQSLDYAYDAIHASPPCQHYANVTQWTGNQADHPDLIPVFRELLQATGLPYIIENVRTKALDNPLVLCGSQFGLKVIRHRYFETSPVLNPFGAPCHHAGALPFEHKGERAYADAMGCQWMTAVEARQAIPPAYTHHLGTLLLEQLEERVPA